MKTLICALTLFVSLQASAYMGTLKFQAFGNIDISAELEKFQMQEMQNTNSSMYKKLTGLALMNDAVLKFNGADPMLYIDFTTLVPYYSGKSGAAQGGSSMLVPIYLGYAGSGANTELIAWLVVKEDDNAITGFKTITIGKILGFNYLEQ